MKIRRVLFFATSLGTGGTEHHLAALAGHFSSRFEIDIAYLKERGAVGDLLAARGLRVFRCAGIAAAVAACRGRDLVHTFLYRGNIIGRLAARVAGVPRIISSQRSMDAWKKPVHILADRVSARWCGRIVANARYTADLLVRRERVDARRISVVYNGVDLERFASLPERDVARRMLGVPHGTFCVAVLSRLHREKGSDLIPAIAAASPEMHFLVAGDGPEREGMRMAIAGAGCADRVTLCGWADPFLALAAGDVLLLPSREESFPQAVLEAMAAGLPVVAADVGGVPELVQNSLTGLLARVEDTPAFAACLRQLAGNPRMRADMGASARKRAALFSQKTMLASMEDIYHGLE